MLGPLHSTQHTTALMKRLSNQDIERYYFEQFKTHYPVPDGKLIFDDKPDVIIQGVKKLGIEIANLYINSGNNSESEQVQRRRRAQVIDLAQKLYLTVGGKRTELSFDFDPRYPILDIESVAEAIASFASEIADMPTGEVSPTCFKRIPYLRFVYNNAKEYPDAKWRSVQNYTVPFLSVDRVFEIVRIKTEKAKAYQECDAYWLLLIVDFIDRSQDQELLWPKGVALDESLFERVLIYKPQFAQIIDIPKQF